MKKSNIYTIIFFSILSVSMLIIQSQEEKPVSSNLYEELISLKSIGVYLFLLNFIFLPLIVISEENEDAFEKQESTKKQLKLK